MILQGKRVAAENTSITSIEVGDLLAVLVTDLEKIMENPREKSESEKTKKRLFLDIQFIVSIFSNMNT